MRLNNSKKFEMSQRGEFKPLNQHLFIGIEGLLFTRVDFQSSMSNLKPSESADSSRFNRMCHILCQSFHTNYLEPLR